MIPSLYESFNARNYTPGQVAETFIPNEEYNDLWRNEHTVVLGPRGSGKTTLFKMLTVQAIYAWDDSTALELRKRRPFNAIYVPTDMHWHHQLKHAEDRLRSAPKFSDSASRAAVTTSVLIAITKTFQDLLSKEISATPHAQVDLCKILTKEWLLHDTMPSLELIGLALKSRIGEIRRLINRTTYAETSDLEIGELPEYFHLDYFACMDIACSGFDIVFKTNGSRKWALCLDELELAPAWLQEMAFSQQRSTEQGYLVKLSTSPIPSLLGLTEARPKQDLRLISIWNHAGHNTESFSENLSRSVIRRRLGREISPKQLFGKSDIIGNADDSGKYSRGSKEWKLFRELAEWDPSVRDLLLRYGIDPRDPYTSDIGIRDKVLRKAKPIALLRQAFLKPNGEKRLLLRSRKLATIYFGREAIYRISDGNPRRLIGILGDLCAKVRPDDSGHVPQLSENDQAEVLERASKQFFGYVHALPGGTVKLGEHNLDLASLLKAISTFFRQQFLGEDFPLDPVGSFKVDSYITDKVIELLRLGVYHGAIVHVDPVPDTIETNLRGKRFRLSYMLAPLSRLPITLYEPISLGKILRASTRMRVKRAFREIVGQQELPIGELDSGGGK